MAQAALERHVAGSPKVAPSVVPALALQTALSLAMASTQDLNL